MSMLTTVYATDEDVALRASADYSILCPKDQKLAAGTDGSFSPSDQWTLMSTALNPIPQGLAPGQIVKLTKPLATFSPPGDALVIVSVGPGAITLRRKGQAPGFGQPPAPAPGLSGVEFTITTLGPQIERASYDLNRRYGIDDLVAGRRAADLYDPREVREATILTVLYRQYLDMSREGEQNDIFAAKARSIKADLDELLARVSVQWGPAGAGSNAVPATSRFSTRVAR